MIRVEIDRTKWWRGRGSNASRLLIGEQTARVEQAEDGLGKMCCLGFASLALGCTSDEIEDANYPRSVDRELPNLNQWNEEHTYRTNTEFADKAAIINDGFDPVTHQAIENVTSEQIETALIPLAAENGFEFVFIN